MFTRRALMTFVIGTSLLTGIGSAIAKNAHHHNGHNLLGAKIHKNGKHEMGKIGTNAVVAEVSNDKVTGMSAGDLPVQRFKSSKKMADLNGDKLQVAANGTLQLAQMDTSYYAYCFDTGLDLECYWYPSTDVVLTDPWSPYPY